MLHATLDIWRILLEQADQGGCLHLCSGSATCHGFQHSGHISLWSCSTGQGAPCVDNCNTGQYKFSSREEPTTQGYVPVYAFISHLAIHEV